MVTVKCIEQRVGDKMRKANVVGLTTELPLVGEVTFDENSTIEISDEVVEEFLKLDCGLKFEVVNEESVKDKKEEGQKNQNEKEIYKAELEKLTDLEITALLSIHPSKDTKKLNTREAKINFLVNKQVQG